MLILATYGLLRKLPRFIFWGQETMRRAFRAILIAVLLMLGSHQPFAAEPTTGDAIALERQLADKGDVLAQYFLALFYYEGNGVPQNYVEALKYFRMAADQGNPAAQYMLGGIYAMGKGVPVDIVRAHMWMNLAAAQGNENAREGRDLLAKRMTPAQIAEAQKNAREWKPTTPSPR